MISNIFLIILYNLFYYYIYYLIINILYNLYKISSKMIDKYYCKWFTGVNFIILKKSLFWFLIGSLIPHLVQLRQVVKWRKWGMTQVREWSNECSPGKLEESPSVIGSTKNVRLWTGFTKLWTGFTISDCEPSRPPPK